jgi:hypothetical protein
VRSLCHTKPSVAICYVEGLPASSHTRFSILPHTGEMTALDIFNFEVEQAVRTIVASATGVLPSWTHMHS